MCVLNHNNNNKKKVIIFISHCLYVLPAISSDPIWIPGDLTWGRDPKIEKHWCLECSSRYFLLTQLLGNGVRRCWRKCQLSEGQGVGRRAGNSSLVIANKLCSHSPSSCHVLSLSAKQKKKVFPFLLSCFFPDNFHQEKFHSGHLTHLWNAPVHRSSGLHLRSLGGVFWSQARSPYGIRTSHPCLWVRVTGSSGFLV